MFSNIKVGDKLGDNREPMIKHTVLAIGVNDICTRNDAMELFLFCKNTGVCSEVELQHTLSAKKL